MALVIERNQFDLEVEGLTSQRMVGVESYLGVGDLQNLEGLPTTRQLVTDGGARRHLVDRDSDNALLGPLAVGIDRLDPNVDHLAKLHSLNTRIEAGDRLAGPDDERERLTAGARRIEDLAAVERTHVMHGNCITRSHHPTRISGEGCRGGGRRRGRCVGRRRSLRWCGSVRSSGLICAAVSAGGGRENEYRRDRQGASNGKGQWTDSGKRERTEPNDSPALYRPGVTAPGSVSSQVHRHIEDKEPPPVPTFRPDLEAIPIYVPGRPIDEIARELGITDIVKVASNEHPEPCFPEVQAAIAAAATAVNRYPEDTSHHLVNALANKFSVSPEHIWMGAGSSQLLGCIALAFGGPNTSAVFAEPSFVLYPIGTAVAGAEPIAVPTDDLLRHDLDAMAGAVRSTTTLVYICNPNNPTGTHVPAAALDAFVAEMPDRVLILVGRSVRRVRNRPGLRHRYFARSRTRQRRCLENLLQGVRTCWSSHRLCDRPTADVAQAPQVSAPLLGEFGSSGGRVGGLALRRSSRRTGQDKLRRQRGHREGPRATRAGVRAQPDQLRAVRAVQSAPAEIAAAMLEDGVIVRPMGPWIRVSVGTTDENKRFVTALDRATSALSA